MPQPPHIAWLHKGAKPLTTVDGRTIEVWELRHRQDSAVLSGWAKHFRQHYCQDGEIDDLRKGTKLTREQFLLQRKFPSTGKLGRAVRSGDFAEILLADFIEYILEYWVPRTRWDDKNVPDESPRGTDLIGMKFVHAGATSPKDTLITFESKAQLSGDAAKAILQDAITDSVKDEMRKAFLLSAAKQRLKKRGDIAGAAKIERFQNPEDLPYTELCGAAALFTAAAFDPSELEKSDCSKHPKKDALTLLVISGMDFMKLVHQLYEIAAREA